MKIYLASGNAHKVAELQLLARHGDLPVEVLSARAVGGMPAVAEDTGTFVGNARKKARALLPLLPSGAWALADDSGVCVDELQGAPGVDSAYFAGPQADPTANLLKLAAVMQGVPEARRRAEFRCVLCLLAPDAAEMIFEGVCAGRLLHAPEGAAGFGYDPLFVPDGYTRSYAQLGEDVKNQISHRARAWHALSEWLRLARPPGLE